MQQPPPIIKGQELAKKILQGFNEIIEHDSQQFRLDSFLKYKPVESKKTLCAKIIGKAEQVAECLDCGVCPNSIICQACFSKSNHQGHRFKMIRANGGSCDCGDQQVWKKEGFCSEHSGTIEEISIGENDIKEFIAVWNPLFTDLFERECPVKGLFKSTKLLAGQLCRFLEKLAQTGLYYSKIITALLSSQIQVKDKLTGQKLHSNLIDLILTCISITELQIQWNHLFIALAIFKQSKTLLSRSYIRNYEKMFQNNADEYLGQGCQLFTHQQIVADMINCKTFLTATDVGHSGDIYEKSTRHIHNFGYIAHCKEVNLIYWCNYINSGLSLQKLCLYWQYVEKKWTDSNQDRIHVSNFMAEQHFFNMTARICRVIRKDPIVLDKAIHQLTNYIEHLPQIYNKCFRPFHRLLAFLLANRAFLNPSMTLSVYVDEISQSLLRSVCEPILSCVCFYNQLLHNSNLRVHFREFTKNYTEGTGRLFAYDVLLFKLYITTAKNPNIIDILPEKTKNSMKFLTQQVSEEISEELEEPFIEAIYNIADILAFVCEICCGFTEEIFVAQHVDEQSTLPEHLLSAAQAVIMSYINRLKSASMEQLKILLNSLLCLKLHNFGDILKRLTHFDKTTQKFTCKETVEPINMDYFYSKTELNKLIQREEHQPNYRLSSPIATSNQLVLCAFISDQLLEKLELAVMGAHKQHKSKTIVAAFNYLIRQYCKLYQIGSKCPQFRQLHMICRILSNQSIRESLNAETVTCIPIELSQYLNKLNLNTKDSPPKQNIKEIQRRKIQEMKQKQKAFTSTLKESSDKLEEQVFLIDDKKPLCNICKSLLEKSLYAYPICIQLSNLSSLVRYQQENSQSFYISRQPTLMDCGLVLTRCSHLFHLKCLNGEGIGISCCSICKHKAHTFMVATELDNGDSITSLDDKTAELVLLKLWRAANSDLQFSNIDKISIITLVLESIHETIGYQAIYETTSFVNNQLKIYKDLAKCVSLFIKALNLFDREVLIAQLHRQIKSAHTSTLKKLILNTFLQVTKGTHVKSSNICQGILENIHPQKMCQQEMAATILQYLFGESSSEIGSLDTSLLHKRLEVPEHKIKNGLKFRQLPTKYTPLHTYRKSCPKCHNLNPKICMCLMCSWVGCSGCKQGGSLNEHATMSHSRTCLFLWMELGKFVLLSEPKATIVGIAYVNEFGEGVNVMGKSLDEFELDMALYIKAQKIILQGNSLSYIEDNQAAGRDTFNSAGM